MISVLRLGRSSRNRAFVAFSGYSIKYNSSKEMNNFFALPQGFNKPVSAPKAFALPGSSASLDSFTASFLVPKYSRNDLHRIFKAVLEAWTSTIATLLPEDSQERFLKARFPDIYQKYDSFRVI